MWIIYWYLLEFLCMPDYPAKWWLAMVSLRFVEHEWATCKVRGAQEPGSRPSSSGLSDVTIYKTWHDCIKAVTTKNTGYPDEGLALTTHPSMHSKVEGKGPNQRPEGR